jgi:RNA polymerase sigma-70 factor (ECF subfamily)
MIDDLSSALRRLAEDRHDEGAWSVLYNRLRPWVFTAASRQLGRADDRARDATQEVFFRLAKYGPFERLTDPDAFRSYLRVVTRNVTSLIHRQSTDHPEVSMGLLGDPEFEPSEPVRTPFGEILELRQLLQGALKDLAPEDRQAVTLRMEGFSIQEVAERLGITPGNAAVRLHRIRARLRGHPLLRDLI